MLNYFQIINENIEARSRTYKIYVVHATLVTNKALRIGRRLGLVMEALQFIEEAGMLHDIGVVRVESPKMDCHGELPYIAHGVEGAKILRAREENGGGGGGGAQEKEAGGEGNENGGRDGSKRVGRLERHALVAERHVGVGLTRVEIEARGLPLPAADYVPESIEEQVITYADLFFSKREETLWREDSAEEIERELAGYGEGQVEVFRQWRAKFGE